MTIALSLAALLSGSALRAEAVDFKNYSSQEIEQFITLERIAGMIIGTCTTAQLLKAPKEAGRGVVAGALDAAASKGEKYGIPKDAAVQFVRRTVFSVNEWASACRPYWPAEYW